MYRTSPIIRWRRYEDRYLFNGLQCIKCKKVHYPAKKLCVCGSKDFKTKTLSGKGKLLTFTEVKYAPAQHASKAPYLIGIVELEEGPRIGGQIVDVSLDELKIGMPLERVFRRMYESGREGAIHYGAKFMPVF